MATATPTIGDVSFDWLTDYTREVLRITRRCPNCEGQNVVCVRHQPEVNAYLRTYMDARQETLKSRTTRCTPYARRTVITVRV